MLAGTGWLYAGDERFRVGPGDFFAKSEGPKLAHQFVNDGEADLRILSIGEHREDDAVEYPTPPWDPGGDEPVRARKPQHSSSRAIARGPLCSPDGRTSVQKELRWHR